MDTQEVKAVEVIKPVAVLPEGKIAPGRFGTGSPITILKVESIKLPNWVGKDVEVTGMSDTADTYIQGVPNYGEGEFDVIYLATQNASMKALRNVAATFVTTYPNGQIDTYTGWINNYSVEIVVKDKIKTKLKVRATSDVVSTGTVTGTVPVIGLGTTLTITSS